MSPPTLSPSVVNSLSSSPDWESWSSTLLNCRRSSACSELRGKMKPMWTGANLNWGRGGSRAPQFSYYIDLCIHHSTVSIDIKRNNPALCAAGSGCWSQSLLISAVSINHRSRG